jgi:hypothetical protein
MIAINKNKKWKQKSRARKKIQEQKKIPNKFLKKA